MQTTSYFINFKTLTADQSAGVQVGLWVSQVVLVMKNQPTNSGDIRETALIPGSGRCPGGGHGNPLWCSCLENPMDRGAWWATVYRVAKSQTLLKWLSMHAHMCTHAYIHVCTYTHIYTCLYLIKCTQKNTDDTL